MRIRATFVRCAPLRSHEPTRAVGCTAYPNHRARLFAIPRETGRAARRDRPTRRSLQRLAAILPTSAVSELRVPYASSATRRLTVTSTSSVG